MVKDSKETFHTGFAHNVFFAARQAIRRHASGGNVLIFATVAALVVANIPALTGYYSSFWTQEVRLQLGDFNVFSHGGHPMSLLEFINDALMAVFFFTIGLEIKREVLVGELSSLRQALLPIIGAIGGMIVPVALFMFLSRGTDYSAGAAIPMATDIAFSLGLLGMLGSRVPLSLKIFLTTLAVVDDIGGILVIAVCYSTHIEVMLLVYAAVFLINEPCTRPKNTRAHFAYGMILGFMTMMFRYFGTYDTGVCFAVLAVNALTEPLDRIFDSFDHGIFTRRRA